MVGLDEPEVEGVVKNAHAAGVEQWIGGKVLCLERIELKRGVFDGESALAGVTPGGADFFKREGLG
jgi:hypothetical protein